jgi:hypothetical protein
VEKSHPSLKLVGEADTLLLLPSLFKVVVDLALLHMPLLAVVKSPPWFWIQLEPDALRML